MSILVSYSYDSPGETEKDPTLVAKLPQEKEQEMMKLTGLKSWKNHT